MTIPDRQPALGTDDNHDIHDPDGRVSAASPSRKGRPRVENRTATASHQEWGPVAQATHNEIARLQNAYLADQAAAVAALARLRRGAGKPPHQVPDLWGLLDTSPLYEAEELKDREADLARAENAFHLALTLWALHQQSRGERMHLSGASRELGAAVRQIKGAEDPGGPVRKRFVRLGSSRTVEELSDRLRELVSLLRRDSIPMDYAVLAQQIYRWQRPAARNAVRGSWGRSYQAYQPKKSATTDSGTDPKDVK
ncbi:type I-E CRISPR-associated protein Cse2/CasB [Streptomyces sp. NPDC059909]|uniref:type I-E CRISPR-associated protein Cse2/CasB n=1 Tax=Streptomyces sp. NPDC059909 TaxID=3346998 RepID=UPI0036668F20